MKIGDEALRNGKRVKIIAEVGDQLVARFIEDIEGKHYNRCYLYYPHELSSDKRLISVYDLIVFSGSAHKVTYADTIGVVPYSSYPEKSEIIKQIENFKGDGAMVKRRYKLV